MLERDYIMHLIRQFFESLEELTKQRDNNFLTPTLQNKVNDLYRAYLNRPASFFHQHSPEELIQYLREEFPESQFIRRLEILTETLRLDASIKTSEQEKHCILEKTLTLMEYLDKHSDTFSFERKRIISEIKFTITS